ncbi:MAG: phosphate ABC transporter ATP-binding protein, partial [Desulfovibrio sp.]|nr:phosphate ABC transporter ATP-binding protein [Desulfovibrio sp.]
LEPAVLLLDEPTASLDVHSARAIEDLLTGLAERYPLVVVSHNPRQAAKLAQSLAVMAKGRMQARFERDIPDAGEIGRLLGEA